MSRKSTEETQLWNKINDQNDIDTFYRALEIENSTIVELNFKRCVHIYDNDAQQEIRIPDALVAVIDNCADLEKKADTKRIEMLFANVDKLHFCPENRNDIDQLDTVVFRFVDGYWYFADLQYKELNQYGTNDDATWIRCDAIYYRKL